jgi:hypothetical protein
MGHSSPNSSSIAASRTSISKDCQPASPIERPACVPIAAYRQRCVLNGFGGHTAAPHPCGVCRNCKIFRGEGSPGGQGCRDADQADSSNVGLMALSGPCMSASGRKRTTRRCPLMTYADVYKLCSPGTSIIRLIAKAPPMSRSPSSRMVVMPAQVVDVWSGRKSAISYSGRISISLGPGMGSGQRFTQATPRPCP